MKQKPRYHHGNLRETLLDAATILLKDNGVDGLSLRKLASHVGVSRTAPYHHFQNKNELLCAIAEEGFKKHHTEAKNNFEDSSIPMKERFRSYIHNYVKFAHSNPELYELMFGGTIWKQQQSTEELRDTAYPCFQHQLDMTREWQRIGLINQEENTLRLSQVIWGSIHGIAKLLIDGIYTQTSQIEEICNCAANIFLQNNHSKNTAKER